MQSNTSLKKTRKPWTRPKLLAPVFGIALLAGCAGTHLPGSVSEGTCKVFPRPTSQVYGVEKSDQAWIDETIEAGVAGCQWERPSKRDDPRVKGKEKPKAKGKKSWTGS